MYTYVICAYNGMYGTVYSALYFAIEPDRRTLILILILILIHGKVLMILSIYQSICLLIVNTDTVSVIHALCTVTLSCRVTVLTLILLLILTLTQHVNC
jgi:hypothetical protein